MENEQSKGFPRFSILGGAIAVGLLALVISISLAGYQSATRDKKTIQAENDLQTLKKAVMSYWTHHRLIYPQDVHRSLASSQPVVITSPLKDPWATDSKNTTYGFVKAIDPNIGEYFILFTQGPNKDTRPRLNAASKVIEYSGTGIVVSNLPTKKIN